MRSERHGITQRVLVLEVEVAGKRYILTRRLKGSFDVTVEEQDGVGAAEFISEYIQLKAVALLFHFRSS